MNAGVSKYVYLIWRIKAFLSDVFYFLGKVEVGKTAKDHGISYVQESKENLNLSF